MGHWIHSFSCVDWNNRAQRLARLKEKENFRAVVMPLSFLGAGIGVIALGWEGVVKMDGGRVDLAILVPAAFFALLPIPLIFYRWVRGHFSKRLFA